jgi:2-hydroxymuconate-semialdehyde hydrolase
VANPEIGSSVATGLVETNFHDVGSGAPILLLHGSGPGVSAWANWRLVIGALSDRFRLLAPDLAGFGYTTIPADYEFNRDNWLDQIVAFMDATNVQKAHVIGNSFGGSMALALAIAHPERVDRLVLMGSVGVPFEITPALDAVWGYEPSVDNMRTIMTHFAYDQSLLGDDLIDMRYQASLRTQDDFARMFPAPRQRWVEALSHSESDLRAIAAPTLLVHGRDDQVIPLASSLAMQELIDDSQLHIYGRCGHWTQIERAGEFCSLVAQFLSD